MMFRSILLAVLVALQSTVAVSDVTPAAPYEEINQNYDFMRGYIYKLSGLYLADGSGNTMLLQAPSLAADSIVVTFPSTNGSSGQYLKGDGSGGLSYSAVDLASSSVTGIVGAANGGTGVANNAAATLTRSGNHALTITTTNTTGVTLPTTGTLATLAGSEVLTGKTLSGNIATNLVSGAATVTLPTTTGTLATLANAETLSSKTIASPIVTGTLLLQNPSGSQPELHLSEDPDNGTNKVQVKALAAMSGDYTLTLPPDDGDANEVLFTNGSGVLDWVAVATNPMDSEGDMTYGGAAGVVTKLDSGTSGQILVSGGAAAPAWTTLYGTYTPTISASANFTSTGTVRQFNYSRLGSIVTVTGQMTGMQTTSTGVDSTVTITLPVTTANFGDSYQASGVGVLYDNSMINEPALIESVSGSQTVISQIDTTAQAASTGKTLYWNFSYKIQ